MIFCFGECVQTVDMNQENRHAEALKMRCAAASPPPWRLPRHSSPLYDSRPCLRVGCAPTSFRVLQESAARVHAEEREVSAGRREREGVPADAEEPASQRADRRSCRLPRMDLLRQGAPLRIPHSGLLIRKQLPLHSRHWICVVLYRQAWCRWSGCVHRVRCMQAGILGQFAASAEFAFGTVVQRVMSSPGSARFHYGHPVRLPGPTAAAPSLSGCAAMLPRAQPPATYACHRALR